MSGLEVLGALAAASQLAEQGLKITTTIYDIYRKVRDAPESIRKQTVQVEQLIDIAKLIKGTASLQTDLVASVLRDCTTDAHKVLHSLQQIAPGSELHAPKKLWKALAGITKEKNILEHLTKLEQGKSSLALCIATIDNSLLKSIHLEMVTVQTAVDGISKELPAIRDSIRKVTTVLYAVDVLPTMAEDVGNIHQELAALVQKLTTVYDELPAISGKVAAIHDELLPRMQEDMQKLVLNQSNPAPVSPVQPAKGLVMVPYARNRLFVGRDAQLQDLKVKLANNEHNRVALVGLGGVGKSQLALEHAYRRREEDPQLSVFWVRASNASRFEQDFLQIGKFAKFLESNSLSQDPKETIKKWLDSENSGMWLLILDSADDSEIIFGARKANERMMLKGLSEFLPQSTNGTIIFTTRNRKVGVKFATTEGIITMPNMEAVDAEKLYMAQSGENTTDEDSVAELLARLEYLPLAITQAGSYISENTISTSDYLGMFNESESSRIELLSEEFEDAARDGGSVNPIATTYMISFEQINHSNALAADLLSYMACLDDQSVPKKLLNLPTSPVKATSALGLLKAYSLISADQTNTIFSMHRLVHLATRNWLRIHARFNAWAQVCLHGVSEKFPQPKTATMDLCDLYLPHAQAVYAYGKYLGEEDFSQAELAEKLSQYFKMRGSYHTAVALAEESIKWREKAQAVNNSNWLLAVENLNEILDTQVHQNGDSYLQILPRWERWYLNWEKSLGADNVLATRTLQNLIASLKVDSEFEALQQIHRRRNEAEQRMQDTEHACPTVKTKRFAAEEEAKYDDFVNKRQKSSELQSHHANWEKSLGPHHPITLRSLSNRIEMPYSAWKTIERLGLEHDVPEATLRNSLVVAQNWRSLEDCELDETRAISTNALPLSDLQPLARSTTENVASEHTLE